MFNFHEFTNDGGIEISRITNQERNGLSGGQGFFSDSKIGTVTFFSIQKLGR